MRTVCCIRIWFWSTLQGRLQCQCSSTLATPCFRVQANVQFLQCAAMGGHLSVSCVRLVALRGRSRAIGSAISASSNGSSSAPLYLAATSRPANKSPQLAMPLSVETDVTPARPSMIACQLSAVSFSWPLRVLHGRANQASVRT